MCVHGWKEIWLVSLVLDETVIVIQKSVKTNAAHAVNTASTQERDQRSLHETLRGAARDYLTMIVSIGAFSTHEKWH